MTENHSEPASNVVHSLREWTRLAPRAGHNQNAPAPPPDLTRLQRWFHAVITHPNGIPPGITSPPAQSEFPLPPEHADEIIRPSSTLTSLDRLAIYGSAYHARLLECLRHEYPALTHALGEDTFNAFAFGYLQQYPSQSYTLANLGARFPQYLAETRPANDSSSEHRSETHGWRGLRTSEGPEPDGVRTARRGQPPSAPDPATPSRVDPADDSASQHDAATPPDNWPDFLIDLARLERTYSEVFDAPGPETLTLLGPDDLARLPPDAWPNARLDFVPCVRLLPLSFPVHEYASAVRRRESPELPGPQPTWLVITRRHYTVRRTPVTQPAFELLLQLQHGDSLGEALEHAAAFHAGSLEDFAAHLQSWFHQWAEAGYFRAVHI